MNQHCRVSIVVPVYNEFANVQPLYQRLLLVLEPLAGSFEIIFINDGSRDRSLEAMNKLAEADSRVRILDFSRNFGKEMATTAGVNAALGDAVIMIDSDLQHPPELIPEFIAKWDAGAEVVIGVRQRGGVTDRLTSCLFYKLMRLVSDTDLVPSSTDFRLIDRVVADEFNRLTERRRITRGLIDWLGFDRDYIEFAVAERVAGTPTYGFSKRVRLAFNSIVSLSLLPLRVAGWLGAVIVILSGLLGATIFIDQYLMDDPMNWAVSGRGILAIITLFMSGVILCCLGLVSLYIAGIHGEVMGRPLYVVRSQPRRRLLSGKEGRS